MCVLSEVLPSFFAHYGLIMHSLLPVDSQGLSSLLSQRLWTPSVCHGGFKALSLLKCLKAVYVFRTSNIESFFQDMGHGLSTVKVRPFHSPSWGQQGRNSGRLESGDSQAETGEAAVSKAWNQPSSASPHAELGTWSKVLHPTSINASILTTLDHPRVALITELPSSRVFFLSMWIQVNSGSALRSLLDSWMDVSAS